MPKPLKRVPPGRPTPCKAINNVINGRFEYCDREGTEYREVEVNKPEQLIKGTLDYNFCPYHAALFDIDERKRNGHSTR